MIENPHFQPELLAPAGSLDKLKTSVRYGAQAVYCAGQEFGLRAAAENLTTDELIEGVNFAHDRGSKVYVVLNAYLHDEELLRLPQFLKTLERAGVDAVIASDRGVIETVAEHCEIPIHLSTQASCLNSESGNFWKKLGVKRLILGREASIHEAGLIKQRTGLEVELFIHGSMCMAYSGQCTISNFTQGRDSNRGGCAHSCRFDYSLEHDDGSQTPHSFFMSSKDLQGIALLPEFSRWKIDSIKIEGRMKSALYAATVSKLYREALDLFQDDSLNTKAISRLSTEFQNVPNRGYTTASLVEKAASESVVDFKLGEKRIFPSFAGEVLEVTDNTATLLVRKKINRGDKVEILPFRGAPVQIDTSNLRNLGGELLDTAHVNTLARVELSSSTVCESNVVRA